MSAKGENTGKDCTSCHSYLNDETTKMHTRKIYFLFYLLLFKHNSWNDYLWFPCYQIPQDSHSSYFSRRYVLLHLHSCCKDVIVFVYWLLLPLTSRRSFHWPQPPQQTNKLWVVVSGERSPSPGTSSRHATLLYPLGHYSPVGYEICLLFSCIECGERVYFMFCHYYEGALGYMNDI